MPSFLLQSGVAGNSFFPARVVVPTQFTPSAGNIVVIPGGAPRAYITPAGTLATLTIRLPPNPVANQQVSILSSQIVTALTVTDAAGGAVAGAPTALAVYTEVIMLYTGTVWIWKK